MKLRLSSKLLLYFAFFTVPLGANAISIDIAGVKLTPFRFCIILTCLLIVISKTYNGEGILLYRERAKFSVLFFFVWFLYAVLGVVWAFNITEWFKMLFFLLVGLLCVFSCENLLVEKKDFLNALSCFRFGILLQTIIGWYEVITRDYRFIEMTEKNVQYYIDGMTRAPVGMLGNPNNFATLMLFGFFINLFFSSITNKTKKTFNLIQSINCLVLLFLTTSRANLIGLCLGIAFYLFIKGWKRWILLIAVFIAILIIPQTSIYIEKLLSFNFSGTESDGIRLGLALTGVRYLFKTYGFGIGAGQFASWVQANGTPYYIAYYTSIHNYWIEILTSYGIIIFIGFIIFYCKLFRDNLKQFIVNIDKIQSGLSIIICMILIAFIIASISASSALVIEFIWLFWGFCVSWQDSMSIDSFGIPLDLDGL